MLKYILPVVSFALLGASAANAQTCAQNYRAEGIPMVTAINYKSTQVFPKTDVKRAFKNAHQAVLAEGFDSIRVDKANNAITAIQETSGSGRPQTLRVVVRKAGKGSQVDVVFMVQAGQVAPERTTKAAICRIISAATR